MTWCSGSPASRGATATSSCSGCRTWPSASTPSPPCSHRRCGRSARGKASPTRIATSHFPGGIRESGFTGCGHATSHAIRGRPTPSGRCKTTTRCATTSGARWHPTCRRSRFRCWSAAASRTTTCTAAVRSGHSLAPAQPTPASTPIAAANGRRSTPKPRWPNSSSSSAAYWTARPHSRSVRLEVREDRDTVTAVREESRMAAGPHPLAGNVSRRRRSVGGRAAADAGQHHVRNPFSCSGIQLDGPRGHRADRPDGCAVVGRTGRLRRREPVRRRGEVARRNGSSDSRGPTATAATG